MIIISSKSKVKLGRSRKGLITCLYLKAKTRPKKCKKSGYANRNISKKDLSKIIREFEKLLYDIYEKKRPKHEPTGSYFYLAKQIAKFMIRADSSFFVDQLSAMILFDSSSSVEQICDRFLSTRNYFNSLSSLE